MLAEEGARLAALGFFKLFSRRTYLLAIEISEKLIGCRKASLTCLPDRTSSARALEFKRKALAGDEAMKKYSNGVRHRKTERSKN